MKNSEQSTGVKAVLDAQWAAMRNGVLEQIEARKQQVALAAAAACESMAALSLVRDAAAAQAPAVGAAKPVGLARVVPGDWRVCSPLTHGYVCSSAQGPKGPCGTTQYGASGGPAGLAPKARHTLRANASKGMAEAR